MKLLLLFVAFVSLAPATPAQGSAADYERALGLGRAWRGLLAEFPDSPTWLADGSGLWFAQRAADGARSFVLVDAASGARAPAFDAAALAAALGAQLGEELDPARLEVELVELAADRSSVLLRHAERHWRWFGARGELAPEAANSRRLEALRLDAAARGGTRASSITFENGLDSPVRILWVSGAAAPRPYFELQPGERREQQTYAGHLWRAETLPAGEGAGEPVGLFRAERGGGLARVDADSARALQARREEPEQRPTRTFVREHQLHGREGDETFQLSSDGSAEDSFVGGSRVSPDGRRVLALQTRRPTTREVTLVESAPEDNLQPRLHVFPYTKPGDEIATRRPRLFDLERRQEIPVDAAPFAEAWSLGDLHWSPDSSRVFLRYDRRGHQLRRIYAIDAQSGAVETVLEEHAQTFIDYSQKTWFHWLDETGELLFTSERDGWNHVHKLDLASGTLQQVTRGEFVVRAVERVDVEQRQLWLRVMGLRPGEDPYHVHLARVELDSGELTLLTEADGTHEWSFSPTREHFVARWSRVDQPWVSELRRSADGALVCELGRDDASALHAAGFSPPQRFVAPGRDGATAIHGILIRPSNFEPGRRYPVIESIYAGPHDFHVPKTFSMGWRERTLAELGFIVVQIDGMGTNWRSKAFHDVCWQNLADAGFPDRIAWLRAAAQQHPELDLTRVGIFGGSAGGQSALGALLFHGDFYRVAVADCGCHDNRMDKIWWNEAWMGWPLGPHYEASSNVTHAHRLDGKLLLTVGELDRNVDPASTLQVVAALIRADKDFDFLLVPGAGHGVGEAPYLVRRRMDFFVRHLLGVEPRLP